AICAVEFLTAAPDPDQIVRESARVTEKDRAVAANFDRRETDLESDGSRKTYDVRMMMGSEYWQLLAINGQPLTQTQQAEEKTKLEREIEKRKRETAQERDKRIAQFQLEQKRDNRLLAEFTNAFAFKLLGEQQLNGRSVYAFQAILRPGYRATDKESKV